MKVLFIDGVCLAAHVVIVAVAVDGGGSKHVLGLWEGATENAASCAALLENLTDRGPRTDRSTLGGDRRQQGAGEGGARAVRKVGVDPTLPGAQEAERLDALPKAKRDSVRRALNEAYRGREYERAKRLLEDLTRRLGRHPGAAASLREGSTRRSP